MGLVPTSGRGARATASWPRSFSAEFLAGLTGGIFFCHVLFLNLVRAALDDAGVAAHLGWAGVVVVTFVLDDRLRRPVHGTLLRTPLGWVLTGPIRAEQRARLGMEADGSLS